MRIRKITAVLGACLVLLAAQLLYAGDPGDTAVVSGTLGKTLDEYLTGITPFGFSGALLVAKNGQVVLNKGYGLAVRSSGTKNDAGTIFSVGSITKQFTAAAILKCEANGKLSVMDPIEKFFPDAPADKRGITLHNLLTHTSGIVQDGGGDYEPVGRDEAVKRILALPVEFKPGERFAYSNSGYTLLAAIVELVSGISYEQFLHDSLFIPAGMRWTGYRLPEWKQRTVAHWYVGETDNKTPLERQYPYWFLIGNGGILSTTMDMYRWHSALLGESILPGAEKKKLFTPFLNEYAYGWDVIDSPHGLLIQHNGGSDLGNSAELRRYIDSNAVTMLFCNQFYNGRPLLDAVRGHIQDMVFGSAVDPPPAIQPNTGGRLDDFADFYTLSSGGSYSVFASGPNLTIRATGADADALLMLPDNIDLLEVNALHESIPKIFSAALRGDYSLLEAAMENSAKRLEPVKGLLQNQLDQNKERTGAIVSIEAFGTTPSAMQPGALETTVEFKGEKANFFLRYISRGGKNVGIGPMDIVTPTVLHLQPVSADQFVGYDLASGHTVLLKFDRDERTFEVTGLRFQRNGKPIIAVRKQK